MERPGASILGSFAVHGAIIAAVVATMMFGGARTPMQVVSAVPVQIVSDTVVLGGPGEPSSEPPSTEDAAAAPMEPVVEPTPPEPTPTPAPVTPRPPEKAAATRTPTRPPPPPRTPTRPPPPRSPPPQPGFNPDAHAGQVSPTNPRGTRPPSGGGSTGPARQTSGPVVTAIFEQVYQNWSIRATCDMPGGDALRIQMDVTISSTGRITSGPTLVGAQNSAVYRAAAAEAVRALRASVPFDVPEGFEGGSYRPTFLTERACNR